MTGLSWVRTDARFRRIAQLAVLALYLEPNGVSLSSYAPGDQHLPASRSLSRDSSVSPARSSYASYASPFHTSSRAGWPPAREWWACPQKHGRHRGQASEFPDYILRRSTVRYKSEMFAKSTPISIAAIHFIVLEKSCTPICPRFRHCPNRVGLSSYSPMS